MKPGLDTVREIRASVGPDDSVCVYVRSAWARETGLEIVWAGPQGPAWRATRLFHFEKHVVRAGLGRAETYARWDWPDESSLMASLQKWLEEEYDTVLTASLVSPVLRDVLTHAREKAKHALSYQRLFLDRDVLDPYFTNMVDPS